MNAAVSEPAPPQDAPRAGQPSPVKPTVAQRVFGYLNFLIGALTLAGVVFSLYLRSQTDLGSFEVDQQDVFVPVLSNVAMAGLLIAARWGYGRRKRWSWYLGIVVSMMLFLAAYDSTIKIQEALDLVGLSLGDLLSFGESMIGLGPHEGVRTIEPDDVPVLESLHELRATLALSLFKNVVLGAFGVVQAFWLLFVRKTFDR